MRPGYPARVAPLFWFGHTLIAPIFIKYEKLFIFLAFQIFIKINFPSLSNTYMRYGFIIDNRKCIGCHACTTACKSEHDVPVGVNRTWVKYIEKGVFPDSRRVFSVMRCNHCTDAPCVEICPVEALFTRDDGIVDFDNRRCIACKSCMQACPYDALYVDPSTHTAAKCNYCAHRIDVGLEPACVNVCPEHAIISGDMDNPDTEIAQLLSRQSVVVRKPEKFTSPNLFYIQGDQASLTPMAAKDGTSLWNSQTLGVGHYAKEAEKLAFTNSDVIDVLYQGSHDGVPASDMKDILKGTPRKAYQAPNKGILWGWEVSGYVLTKAISAGLVMMLFLALFTGKVNVSSNTYTITMILSLVFLGLTGGLLVKDLDRPDRFLNVLLRPQWRSWLVRGGYGITVFGGLTTLLLALHFFEIDFYNHIILTVTTAAAVFVAIYTAFLFAQAKGRDFWQSPSLVLHMLIHSLMAGAGMFAILTLFIGNGADWISLLKTVLLITLLFNVITVMIEINFPHPTLDAKKTVEMITKTRYKTMFWGGVMLLGNILPLALLGFVDLSPAVMAGIGVLVLIGVYLSDKIWVEAPQRIPLT